LRLYRRLGHDDLLVAADGKSHISVENPGVAMIYKLENPAHSHQGFTAGY
jgi:hypothetical protein